MLLKTIGQRWFQSLKGEQVRIKAVGAIAALIASTLFIVSCGGANDPTPPASVQAQPTETSSDLVLTEPSNSPEEETIEETTPQISGTFDAATEEGYSVRISYEYLGSEWQADPKSAAPGKTTITGAVNATANILNTTDQRQNPKNFNVGLKLLYKQESPVCATKEFGIISRLAVDEKKGPFYCLANISDFAGYQTPLEPDQLFEWATPQYSSVSFRDVKEKDAEKVIHALENPDYIVASVSSYPEFSTTPAPLRVSEKTCKLLVQNLAGSRWDMSGAYFVVPTDRPAPACK